MRRELPSVYGGGGACPGDPRQRRQSAAAQGVCMWGKVDDRREATPRLANPY